MNHNSPTQLLAKAMHLFFIAALAVGLALGIGPAPVAHAATFTVSSTADAVDANPGDGVCATAANTCTLRAAIMEANAFAGDDTIILPPGTYALTITGRGEDAAATGDLDITSNLTINGAGAAATLVDAGGIDRVFQVIGNVTATISGVTIQGGVALAAGGLPGNGGGISNGTSFGGPSGGSLTLNDSVLRANFSECIGSAVFNDRTFTSNNSTITENVGGGVYCLGPAMMNFLPGNMILNNTIVSNNTPDGGVYNNSGTLTLNGSTVSGNSGRSTGPGGIYNAFGTTSLNNSTVRDNTTDSGGGIFIIDGTVTLTNSTISGNVATTSGGGIATFFSGTVNLINSTISGNTAPIGSGLNNPSGPTVNSKNTILARNMDAGGQALDCSGTLTSQGYNLIQSTTGCAIVGDTTGNLIGVDPLLGPLQDNGGPTFTYALLSGSPAVDAGNPVAPGSGGNACESTDQRGVGRPQGARCDIGAFELEGASKVLQVTIDIKPGKSRNRVEIEPDENGSIAVAILSTQTFDAPQQVDKNSLTFGRTGDEDSLYRRGREDTPDCHVQHVNNDRRPDLVCRFLVLRTSFLAGDTIGILKGRTVDGALIEGRDSVKIVIDDDHHLHGRPENRRQ